MDFNIYGGEMALDRVEKIITQVRVWRLNTEKQ